jgi:WD40 repeat protein
MNNGYVINVFDPTIATMGYRYPQSDLALAIPNSNNEYLFFQCFMDSTTGQADLYVPSLLTTYLSMSGNANHGVVLYRDSLILKDTLSFHITACRHANGRDWWLLVRKLNSNCYYRILLTNQGAKVLPDMTCAGITSQFGGDGPCCFSPDGNKFAIINYLYGIVLYDFDRCTGTLSNPYSYPIPELLDSVWAINGLSFSPNSRFLYSAIEEYVFQFDTWQSNPLSNPDTIGRYDGFTDPFGVYYCEAQLAPDGKIYLAACNGASDYSVIDSPDMQGSACHFMPHSLHTTAYQNGQPITPNYRLGRLIGSACDTLTGLANIDLGSAIKLYPNPTQNLVTIDYGSVDWSSYNKLFLALKDMAGNQLYTSDLPRFSGIHRIEMSTFSSGLYLIEIQDDKGAILAIKKISKIE